MLNIYQVLGLIALYMIIQFILTPIFKIYKIKFAIKDSKNVITYFFPFIGFYSYVIFPEKNDDHKKMRQIFQENPDFKAYLTNYASRAYVVLGDVSYIQELLVEKSHLYKKFTLLVFNDHLFGGQLTQEQHKQRREIFAPVFHFDQLKRKIPMIKQTSSELLDRLKMVGNEKSNINLLQQMQKSAGDLVVRAFFGEEFVKSTLNNKPISIEVADILQECAEITKQNPFAILRNLILRIPTHKTPKFLFTRREKNIIERIENLSKLMKNEMLKRLDQIKKNEQETEDFLVIYIKSFFQQQFKKQQKQQDEEKQKNFDLDFQFVMQQFMTIFVAGMDTTAHSTAMAIYLLAKNPECQQKLRSELQKVKIFSGEEIDHEKLKQADYLTGCINETLRLYTPAPTMVPRIADQDHMIGPIPIKKGTFVDAMLLGCMNNPKYFPDPNQYDPERWIKRDQPFKNHPFSYIPFNAGPRNCLGQHLAMLELKIYVTYMVQNFIITPNENVPLEMVSKPLYGPKNGHLVNLQLISV